MKRFLPYYSHLRRVRLPFIGALLCGMIFGIATGLGLPAMINKVLPALFPEGGVPQPIVFFSQDTLAELPAWLGWLRPLVSWIPDISVPASHVLLAALLMPPIAFAVRGLSQFYNVYLLNYAGIRVLESVRADIFSHLQFLHLDFFRKHKSGDLISRVSNDTTIVRGVIVEVTNDIIIQPFTLIGALIFVVGKALQDPATVKFLLALLIVPVVVLPIRYIGRKVRIKAHRMLAQAGELNSTLTESLQSPREIRAYNLEQREISRFREQVRKFFTLQMKVVKYDKMLSPIIEFISACGISFAIYEIHGSKIGLPAVVALVGALYFAYTPIKVLGSISNRIQQGQAALDRLEAILHAPIEVASPANPKPIPAGNAEFPLGGRREAPPQTAKKNLGAPRNPAARAEIAFENVTFAYDPGFPVLRDVTITIAPGEIIGLVGATGAGKTTFINLIPRFYDVTAGRITLNNLDIRETALADLRNHIALVSQHPILFNDTIYNNIALGRPDSTPAQVREAARRAHAADFIETLPEKWDTIVGERGDRLSGGQRQRIAIARAFLRDAPILILDEATSALDTESESQIQRALDELTRGKTTFIIAHRFSTIRNATKILVFESGRIIATGAHADLYRTNPVYKNLYDLQSRAAN